MAAQITTSVLGMAANIGLISKLVKRRRVKKSALSVDGMLADYQVWTECVEGVEGPESHLFYPAVELKFSIHPLGCSGADQGAAGGHVPASSALT